MAKHFSRPAAMWRKVVDRLHLDLARQQSLVAGALPL